MISPERLEKGLYWQRAWTLVEGCEKVSPGCDNSWAEAQAVMRASHPNKKISDRAVAVTVQPDETGEDNWGKSFNGEVLCREDNLGLPLHTKQPTVFAVWNDLFHEDVTDEFRDRAYAVMALCPQHTFLVLTKRAKRMSEYFCGEMDLLSRRFYGTAMLMKNRKLAERYLNDPQSLPLPNVWHGITAENQQMANLRIPYLLQVPGKRFLSIEPMLEAVNINFSMSGIPGTPNENWCEWCGGYCGDDDHDCYEPNFGIHAVLLGGESGKNARPMNPDWVRAIREECDNGNTPFFFKQWGEWLPECHADVLADGIDEWGNTKGVAQSSDIPPLFSARVGKKKAGRTLDGMTHDDLPWIGSKK